jgi:tRNA threonylcarbamoyladenosine biosynthesis protein TsaB
MIILLDTSTPECRLTLVDGDTRVDDNWVADRTLADKLIGYLREQLSAQGKTWQDVTGIGVFKGPGSFTGLRIGLTVMNTIADSLEIPIVGESGDDWKEVALNRLKEGQNDKLVMPLYGRDANITKPRK